MTAAGCVARACLEFARVWGLFAPRRACAACLPPGGCVAAVLRPTAVWRGLADDDAGEVPNARLACSRSASPALA